MGPTKQGPPAAGAPDVPYLEKNAQSEADGILTTETVLDVIRESLSGSPSSPWDGRTPAAADTPGTYRALAYHASALHPVLQTGVNCSNFPQ
jgi:hypothetical protein